MITVLVILVILSIYLWSKAKNNDDGWDDVTALVLVITFFWLVITVLFLLDRWHKEIGHFLQNY